MRLYVKDVNINADKICGRVLSISGVILNNGALQRTLANAIQIFQDTVTVRLQFGERKRKAACHVAVFENNERDVYLQHFVLQMIADNSFFEDWEDTKIAVYKRENLLKTTFTLPCVFSKRTNETEILVTGQENSEPIFFIENTVSSASALAESGIELTNTLPDGTEQRKDSESVARWVVEQAFSDVDNFVLGPVCGLESYEEFWRNTTNSTFDVVRDCLARQDAGHRVLFDTANKQWVFEVYQGTKRQTVISEANRNAYDTQYTEKLADYYTSGYYEFTPESEEGQEPPSSEWLYLSGDKTGIYKWDAVLSGSTESEAKSDLKNRRWEKEITASLRNMEFGKDYQLGDQLRIQLQAGRFQKTFEKEITGVNFYAQDNEIGEKPIFNEEE